MTEAQPDTAAIEPELIDAFDDALNPLGPIDRSIVHRRGLWHQVFHCLIVRSVPPARALLQRRQASARSFAGLLDLSATGHLAAGEQPHDGVRELYEEIGVVASPADLVALGRRLIIDDAGEGRNREIVHAFLLTCDRTLESFDLIDRDVDGLVEVELAALLQILQDPAAAAPCREVDATGRVFESVCRASDLVPAVDGYWTVLAVMAERFVNGATPLAI
jgi:8-oxo-dGTP pyrophosphatase MutT (NUDIX family)